MRYSIIYLFPFFITGLLACNTSRQLGSVTSTPALKLVSEYTIPFNKSFNNTVIGGLSGIDYDSSKQLYYFISDDRSAINPARFYTAEINIHDSKIDTVIFHSVTFFKDQLGKYYPSKGQDALHNPDPEALRFNPTNNTFIWTSEGERIIQPSKKILENPAITECEFNGNFKDTFRLPTQLQMSDKETGPRQNGVFEGITFDKNYQNIFVSVEEPLYQDGPRAGTADSSGIVRILQFDLNTKKEVAQFAYPIDPVAYAPITPSAFKVNGISDILWYDKNRFIIIERSYSTGRLSCTIKVFLADISTAENINNTESLKNHAGIKMVSKKFLLNMDDLGIYIDNIEGVTFGPKLSNGKRSLLFVSDNNFNPLEQTQIFLFEIN